MRSGGGVGVLMAAAPATATASGAAGALRPGTLGPRDHESSGPRPAVVALVLAGILLAALGVRLWGIDHGLPWAYNADEELHFVPRAVEMFAGSLNPGYFENPPALTYLLHAVFRVRFLEGWPFGSSGLRRAFLEDPTAVYLTARVTVAAIGTLVVGLVYLAGRRFAGAGAGLVAAALIAFAFLPAFYSKQALNDVVTLAPIAVALVASLSVVERGRWLDFVLAGAAVGVATATKYTAGAMLAVVGLAALARWRSEGTLARAASGLVLAGVAFVVAFFVLNPFALLELDQFLDEVQGQGEQAGGFAKLGQEEVPGWLYYLWTLSWGFGVLPALAALAGGVLLLREDWRRALLLVAFPVLLFLFLGAQARFFGRWLLPAYPALAVLAGYAATRLADRLSVSGGRRGLALAGVGAVLVAQGLFETIRSDVVLSRADTRAQAREWLFAEVPAGSRVVVEPFLPQGFFGVDGRVGPERFDRFPVKRPFQGYTRRLAPDLIETYRRGGYCWVVTGSHQRERGLKDGSPGARAYYGRLDRESREVAGFSPYRPGAEPVPFNFDLSFNYVPGAYERPGPVVAVRRLARCRPR